MATNLTVSRRNGVMFRTTDATPVVAVNFQTRKSKVYSVEVEIVAAYSDTSKAALYRLQGLFRTTSAGVLAQVGSTASVITEIEDTAGMACTMAASGTTVQVTVTGVAGTNIQWKVDGNVQEVDYINLT